MRYKTERGVDVELTDLDIININRMHTGKKNFAQMEEYFRNMWKHAIEKMEHISEHIITDEDSIDIALEFVSKNGTYKDFAKFIRYVMDYNLAYHLLESTK